jgi:amino acid transporter
MEEKVNKKGIGLVGLTALIVSSSIGTGIFGITSSIAQICRSRARDFVLAAGRLWFLDACSVIEQFD